MDSVQRYPSSPLLKDAFSATKRTFEECVTARKFANIAKQMVVKAFIYDMFIAQIRGLSGKAG